MSERREIMALIYLRDEDLLKGLRNRDDFAFEALLENYGDRLLKVCYLILKDLPLAEDAVQEAFIQVYRNIGKFKGESSLYTWIYKIAVNKCRDLLKKRNEYFPIEDVEAVSDTDVEYEAINNLGRKRVKDIVFSLSPIYREIITLFYFEDLSIKEICSILEESEGTIKSKLYRARGILKEILVKEEMSSGKR